MNYAHLMMLLPLTLFWELKNEYKPFGLFVGFNHLKFYTLAIFESFQQ